MRQICGLRPTGGLHIGHYFSVIKPGLQGCTVLIADYHAPDAEAETIGKTVATLKRFGVTKIIHQKDAYGALLFYRLLNLASIGDLERMTQYKSAKESDKTAHLLTYPVLMAHDVAGYDEVLVGEDQKQHVEYARRLIEKLNKAYPFYQFPLPKPVLVGGRIMSLSDPTKKMSKSDPKGCLFLDDSADEIRQKIKRAVSTDAGLTNLINLYDKLNGPIFGFSIFEKSAAFKGLLTDVLIDTLMADGALDIEKEHHG